MDKLDSENNDGLLIIYIYFKTYNKKGKKDKEQL